jgi:hypothetical protein
VNGLKKSGLNSCRCRYFHLCHHIQTNSEDQMASCLMGIECLSPFVCHTDQNSAEVFSSKNSAFVFFVIATEITEGILDFNYFINVKSKKSNLKLRSFIQ